MVGIRLRCDSTGSAKSAFYKGTIVSAFKNSTDDAFGKTSYLRYRRVTRHGGRHKMKKLSSPLSKGKRKECHFAFLDTQGGMSPPQPASPLAPRVAKYPLEHASHTTKDFPSQKYSPIRGGELFGTLPTIFDRSSQSFRESSRDEERTCGSLSSLKRSWSGNRDYASFRYRELHLDESSSMDDGDLKGVSLDLDSLETPSPTNTRTSWIAEGAYHSCSKYSPPAAFPLPVTHVSQVEFGYRHEDYGTNISYHTPMATRRQYLPKANMPLAEQDDSTRSTKTRSTVLENFGNFFNLSDWLTVSTNYDDDINPQVKDIAKWSLAAFLRITLYNPVYPEFSSMQQFSWAVILGVAMGILTAVWKTLIEFSVNLVWKLIPELLLDFGVFTELDGRFPLYHYMWITPMLFGGVLSYSFAALPNKIPNQNDWIHSLHSRGVQESDTFGLLILLSTAGMASGLSLGPELPLILTSGMIGSWLGILTKQSILSARVLNLTAASAAVGGFFGFPMAGALFVLEVPHRTGLQYFEALSPATISSIVAVLTNRLATGNDITGYYKYPFLNDSLPSSIFHDAIVLGLFGGAVGILYTKAVLALKGIVHQLFHQRDDKDYEGKGEPNLTHTTLSTEESSPLVNRSDISCTMDNDYVPFTSHVHEKPRQVTIAHEATRAGVTGAIVGFVVGITSMFLPHVMFWGESQLQNLIDKGRTPLPVFGSGDEPSASLVALGFCMVDRTSKNGDTSGFSISCSAAIAIAKIFVTGLSLGTGIVGGHFWAPLFVGCAASHFLTDSVAMFASVFDVTISLSMYPCVALLCIMGSCHVVTFRAHMAIILILTLTIDAFDLKDGSGSAFRAAGDYSAVFPLLTVSVFVALQISRQTVFYEKQRSRGDIMALPEVLCEPGKEGRPLVMDYEGNVHKLDEDEYDYESDESSAISTTRYQYVDDGVTQKEIEAQFNAQLHHTSSRCATNRIESPSSRGVSSCRTPLPPRREIRGSKQPAQKYEHRQPCKSGGDLMCTPDLSDFDATLDRLLSGPIGDEGHIGRKTHRRTRSEPFQDSISKSATLSTGKSLREKNLTGAQIHQRNGKLPIALKQVSSFGQVDQEQPSLLEQARKRAASFAFADRPK